LAFTSVTFVTLAGDDAAKFRTCTTGVVATVTTTVFFF
jgi:hypothetical protein